MGDEWSWHGGMRKGEVWEVEQEARRKAALKTSFIIVSYLCFKVKIIHLCIYM